MIWWTTNRRLRKRNDQLVKQVEWLEGAMARQEEMLDVGEVEVSLLAAELETERAGKDAK